MVVSSTSSEIPLQFAPMKFSWFIGLFAILAGPVQAKEQINFLSPTQIRQVTQQRIGAIERCYQGALRHNSTQFGTITVVLHVNSTGGVDTAWVGLSSLGNQPLENCIVTAIGKFEFPAPSRAKLVSISLLLSTPTSPSEVMDRTQKIFRPRAEVQ